MKTKTLAEALRPPDNLDQMTKIVIPDSTLEVIQFNLDTHRNRMRSIATAQKGESVSQNKD
jgi:hypothetical protein